MGQLTLSPSATVYVDTNTIIYRVEQIQPFLAAAAPLWDALDAGQATFVTSELTLLEVLVKPLREGKSDLVSLYRAVLLGTAGLTLFPVTRSILESAAHLRAATNLKTPDAIHAATALSCHATVFVTNDLAFRRVQGLAVTILSELAAT